MADRLTAANRTASLDLFGGDDAGLFAPDPPTNVTVVEISPPRLTRQTTPPPRPKTRAEEFESLQLLTQYIGPSRVSTPDQEDNDEPNDTSDEKTAEMSKVKKLYLQRTETLDRAKSHLEALTNAVQRDRIPNKLRITVKPLIINREDPELEDPEFQREWQKAIKQSETKLVGCLQNHLRKVIQTTNQEIRDDSEKAFNKLRDTLGLEETDQLLKTTYKAADKERKERKEKTESRKRKREQEQRQPNKRNKRDNQ